MNRTYVNSIRDFEYNNGIIKFNLEEETMINGNLNRIIVQPVCMDYENLKGFVEFLNNQINIIEGVHDKGDRKNKKSILAEKPEKGMKIPISE